jgi:phosphomannomutase
VSTAIKTEISFGTSGLRGPAEGFTPARIAAFVRALLEATCNNAGERTVYVGADLRASSPCIAAEWISAVRSAGWHPVYAGNVPTPALAAFALPRQCPAIMVTGSHIPETFNGIKFYRRDGELLKEDEAPILDRVEHLLPNCVSFRNMTELLEPDPAIARAYVNRFNAAFTANALQGLRVGIDLHSAVGRDLLVEILESLGAECFPFRRSQHFVAVDTEAVDAETIARARELIEEHGLGAVVSTDGDGDRPLAIDDAGTQVGGDVLGALAARALRIDTVVTPLTSTSAIERSGWFRRVVRTRIGSPYVVAAMAVEAETASRLAGLEANGGFLLGSDISQSKGVLAALPTRDSVLPLVATLAMAKATNHSLAALAASMPPRFMKADRVKHSPPVIGEALLADLLASRVARLALDARLADPAAIDTLDGLRMTLQDGMIVHFRQSGNASEMRCYVETTGRESTERSLRELIQGLVNRLRAWGK